MWVWGTLPISMAMSGAFRQELESAWKQAEVCLILDTTLRLQSPKGVGIPQPTHLARPWKPSPAWGLLLPVQVNREQVFGHQVLLHHVVKHGHCVRGSQRGVGQPQDPIELRVGKDAARFLGAQAYSLLGVHDGRDL